MRRIILLSLSILFLIGCAYHHTEPNVTYIYHIPSLSQELPKIEKKIIKEQKDSPTPIEVKVHSFFEKLYRVKPNLAIELGKLPEFQDGVSERDAIALERIINLYFSSSDQEKGVFEEMLKIGKDKHRRYCSPLQALFWLAERREFANETNPLVNYSLEKLLDSAWFFGTEFNEEEAISILNTLKDKIRAKEIIEKYKNDLDYLNKRINYYLNIIGDHVFDDKKIFKGKGLNRWANFKEVTERLNSPELIDFYKKRNFSYVNLQGKNNEYDVFSRKYGDCVGISLFTEYCLKKAGYKAYIIRVLSPTVASGHRVCYFEVDKKGYIMDNGRPDYYGIIEKERYLKWHPLIGFGVNP